MTSILHLALFSFEPELDAAQASEMAAQVRAWPERIGGLDRIVFGPALSTERSKGHQFTLAVTVEGEEGLSRYVAHPVHQQFASWVREHGGSVLAIDTVLDHTAVVHPDGAPA